jgi:D-glycero-alpha-D-manno-heptose 1-phosphate guanylyltransferase
MEAIILAGGLGTRLSSRLSGLPKTMAPIAGQPFLRILLDQLLNAGCNSIILSVGHLRGVIFEAFQESYRGVPIRYAVEENPLGTGGAIRFAIHHATESSVLVLNGDTYLDANFPSMLRSHAQMSRSMTMAVTKVDDMGRYGGVLVDRGLVVGFTEKGRSGPGWINAGVYAMDKDFPWPENLAARFSFETDVLAPFLNQLMPAAFMCNGKFLDIGTPEDLDRAQIELASTGGKGVRS